MLILENIKKLSYKENFVRACCGPALVGEHTKKLAGMSKEQ